MSEERKKRTRLPPREPGHNQGERRFVSSLFLMSFDL